MKQILYLLIFSIFWKTSYTQSLDGYWKGSTEHSLLVLNPMTIVLEINVRNDTIITGVLHNYYSKGRFEHVKINGVINWKDSVCDILEEEEISHNINNKIFELCLGRMKLSLRKVADKLYLNGKWKDRSKKLIHCPTLKISFEKPSESPLITIQNDPILYRINDIQKVVELDDDEMDSIRCSLYDNGEIDDDTASVYYDDKLLFKNVRLSQIPLNFSISIDKTKPFSKITLVAENLGLIPPNTALLVIETRKNRYQLTLSSNFSKNASIEFFLKE